LAENLERCGVTNAIVTNESPQMLSSYFTDYFDRVMLDAPCSGEGMFRKSETARKEWKLDSPRSCAIRQNRLLEYASQMVKTGGCIAYTTCTFSPEENEGVIAKFLENHTEFGIKNIEQLGGLSSAKPEWIGLPTDHMVSQTMRIWPHLSSGEGHFIALLIKHKSSKNDNSEYKNKYKISSRRIIKIRETSMARTLFSKFLKAYLNVSFDEKRIHLKGTYVYYLPEMAPNMSGIKVIHPGWWIGSIQKGRFTPSHALAMGIKADQAKHTLSFLSGDQVVSAYIRGNSFSNQGENSWVLVTVDGYPIGWGKRVQNVIKNYYPHGLRQQS
jgi:NOL1/NOP2/fmu family ribosome biogenesis protein